MLSTNLVARICEALYIIILKEETKYDMALIDDSFAKRLDLHTKSDQINSEKI